MQDNSCFARVRISILNNELTNTLRDSATPAHDDGILKQRGDLQANKYVERKQRMADKGVRETVKCTPRYCDALFSLFVILQTRNLSFS